MRYLTLFLLLITLNVFSQNNSFYYIDSIPKKEILLQKHWKCALGDTLAWNSPTYNDSQWMSIDPTKDISNFKGLKENGRAWLRNTLVIPSKMAQTPLTLLVNQSMASDIYINGNLIQKIGELGTDPKNNKATNRVRTFAMGIPHNANDTIISIAVRMGYEHNYYFGKVGFGEDFCFRGVVVDAAYAHEVNWHVKKQVYYAWFQMGVFCILTFLHLALFFIERNQNANLYFSITTLFLTLAFFSIVAVFDIVDLQSQFFYWEFIEVTSFALAYLFLLRGIYAIYKRPLGFMFWLVVIVIFLVIASSLTPYSPGSIGVEMVSELLITLEIIRVTARAVREKKYGAKLIIIGMILSLIMFVLFYADLVLESKGLPSITGTSRSVIFYQIALIGVPIYISLYLVFNFSKMNKDLLGKLKENEALSQQNLIKEQENKQILANQNQVLEQQVHDRTLQLEQSLEHLKATQNQLIQKEKMASLGELTAGVAHEIQNPLNFVNNFSELSVDLAKELNEELDKEAIDKNTVKDILKDLTQNQDKINIHGKRASNIVKGMLEHSNISTGQRELTDINALCEQYIRLVNQGMKAKDFSFNVLFPEGMSMVQTNFQEDLPKINIIPQDIGRVILNLINNAFYAVHQRKQQLKARLKLASSLDETYTPSVSVSTKQLDNQIVISVKDNGSGIPDNIKAKIFQPFFTTKPTGEGTGLGLSLAYDIVTKGHSGTIDVGSTEGAGSEFIIYLPVS